MAASSTLAAAWQTFPPQVPIGPYVADFACMAARLIIEVDGSQHGDTVKVRDDSRTRWPEREGYRVLSFWNNELSENIKGVLEAIHAAPLWIARF
jgi:very-short-patch-repair endonuclease